MSKFHWGREDFNGIETENPPLRSVRAVSDMIGFSEKYRSKYPSRRKDDEPLRQISIKDVTFNIDAELKVNSILKLKGDEDTKLPSFSVRHVLERIMTRGVSFRNDTPFSPIDLLMSAPSGFRVSPCLHRLFINGFTCYVKQQHPGQYKRITTTRHYASEKQCPEEALLESLGLQISVGVIVGWKSLLEHRGKGIYMGPSVDEMDAMLVPTSENTTVFVIYGYGTKDDADYYYVKNSWGEDFGDGGYGKIRRDLIVEMYFPGEVEIHGNIFPERY